MFALLKKKNPYETAAEAIYAQLLQQSRARIFYAHLGVPDSFTGRFDLLVLHVFLIINRMTGEGAAGRDFNQALFDATFADMDETLREVGIGDMGVPKHMRRMMQGFNGRIHAYSQALADGTMEDVLRRNVYAGMDIDAAQLAKMQDYVSVTIRALQERPVSDILEGRRIF